MTGATRTYYFMEATGMTSWVAPPGFVRWL